MSKSLGNFFTIRDILKQFDPEVVRFFILRAHYRSPLNYSDSHLRDARLALTRLYTALKDARAGACAPDWNESHAIRFREAMDDDFGTPEAVAVLFDLANEVNRGHSELAPQLRALGALLGILQRDPTEFLRSGPGSAPDADTIATQIELRAAAKRARDFAAADRIRDGLLQNGVVLEDGPQGTTWRRGPN